MASASPVFKVGSGEYLQQAVIPAKDSHIDASETQRSRRVWQPLPLACVPPCRCCAGPLADSCVFFCSAKVLTINSRNPVTSSPLESLIPGACSRKSLLVSGVGVVLHSSGPTIWADLLQECSCWAQAAPSPARNSQHWAALLWSPAPERPWLVLGGLRVTASWTGQAVPGEKGQPSQLSSDSGIQGVLPWNPSPQSSNCV